MGNTFVASQILQALPGVFQSVRDFCQTFSRRLSTCSSSGKLLLWSFSYAFGLAAAFAVAEASARINRIS